MAYWQLIDGSQPVDDPADFPKVEIHSGEELRKELEMLRHREPGIFALNSPADAAVRIGMGGPLAGLTWFANPQLSGNYRVILADRHYCETPIEFAAEEASLTYWPDELLPVDQAIEIVLFFYQNRQLPDWVNWKEWDDTSKKWLTRFTSNRSKAAG